MLLLFLYHFCMHHEQSLKESFLPSPLRIGKYVHYAPNQKHATKSKRCVVHVPMLLHPLSQTKLTAKIPQKSNKYPQRIFLVSFSPQKYMKANCEWKVKWSKRKGKKVATHERTKAESSLLRAYIYFMQ